MKWTRELAVMHLGRLAVGGIGLLCGCEAPSINHFAVNADAGAVWTPCTLGLIEDALIAARVSCATQSISIVLVARRYAKVMSSVVERIAILVVALAPVAFYKAKDEPVHVDEGLSFVAARIMFTRLFDGPRSPRPLIQPLIVGGVNDGDLALGQWNKAIRLIQRLNNRLAHYAMLGHESTLEWICGV